MAVQWWGDRMQDVEVQTFKPILHPLKPSSTAGIWRILLTDFNLELVREGAEGAAAWFVGSRAAVVPHLEAYLHAGGGTRNKEGRGWTWSAPQHRLVTTGADLAVPPPPSAL